MLTEEEQYQVVRIKDATWDGRFVFAVRTTGVFCRPSCAARTPLRRNVEFFERPEQALAAGYRACLRCRPMRPTGAEANAAPAWVPEVCRLLSESDPAPSLSELAQRAGCSASSLQRVFKLHVGVSPKAYAVALRQQRLRQGLQTSASVTRAAYGAGYGSSGRLYAEASGALGMTPQSYLARGQGETICYAVASSPLGCLLVASTERGVCAVSLGAEPSLLVDELVRQFAKATLQPSDQLATEVAAILASLGPTGSDPALALDIRGTAFQHRVWQALRAIPRGETRTYQQLAAEIGAPRAVRAVGSACAANRIAVLVPCHRVLRGDGELGGFRWGIDVKRQLLEDERPAVEAAAAAAGAGDTTTVRAERGTSSGAK